MSLTSRGILSDFLLSFGALPRIRPEIISASCMSVPNSLTDIWSGCDTQQIKTYLTTAETLDLSSTSAGDSISGTGARQIELSGLDNNFDRISEVIDLNGLATVTTTNSFIRLNFAVVSSSGTFGGTGTGANEGVITIESSSTNNLEGKIGFLDGIPTGRMLNSNFCTPRNTRAVIRNSVNLTLNNNLPADLFLMSRENNADLTSAPFGAPRIAAVFNGVQGVSNININTPPFTDGGADVWFSALPGQNNTPISLQYSFVLGFL